MKEKINDNNLTIHLVLIIILYHYYSCYIVMGEFMKYGVWLYLILSLLANARAASLTKQSRCQRYPGNSIKSLFPRRELYCRDYKIIIK